MDSGPYPWFYRGWPPKESIGRTDPFVARASSHISKEMIELSFLECFQIMVFLCYFFLITSCFLLPLFFFFKVQARIGVRIIHGRALYRGKYGKPDLQHFFFFLKMLTNTKIPTCFNEKASTLAQSCMHNIPCSTAIFAFIWLRCFLNLQHPTVKN